MSDEHEAQKAQTRALFSELAPDYDQAGTAHFAHFGRRLVELVGVAPGQRVLDVATGRGAVLLPAAEQVGPAGEALGVDLAEGMVAAVNAEATRRGLAASVRVMDAEQLAFPDAAFDRVFCGFGVMFFPNLDSALAEFRRVLKPGGRLGASTWRVSQADELGSVLANLGPRQRSSPRWITEPDELARLLTEAGFGDVRVIADSETFRFTDLEHYWQTARTTGQRRSLDALDPEQAARVRAALAERLRPYQRPDGLHIVATALLATASR